MSKTLYTVQVFKKPHWHDVLTTTDKVKAEEERKKLGKLGRIETITPKR